jgi:hypothetical protein
MAAEARHETIDRIGCSLIQFIDEKDMKSFASQYSNTSKWRDQSQLIWVTLSPKTQWQLYPI